MPVFQSKGFNLVYTDRGFTTIFWGHLNMAMAAGEPSGAGGLTAGPGDGHSARMTGREPSALQSGAGRSLTVLPEGACTHSTPQRGMRVMATALAISAPLGVTGTCLGLGHITPPSTELWKG